MDSESISKLSKNKKSRKESSLIMSSMIKSSPYVNQNKNVQPF